MYNSCLVDVDPSTIRDGVAMSKVIVQLTMED